MSAKVAPASSGKLDVLTALDINGLSSKLIFIDAHACHGQGGCMGTAVMITFDIGAGCSVARGHPNHSMIISKCYKSI